MRNLALVVGLTAACSGTNKPVGADPTGVPSTVAPAPGILLARVPTTSSYRVIACTLGPAQRRACEALLESRVATEVRGPAAAGDFAARIARTRVVETTDGDPSVAVELDRSPGPAVVTSAATLRRDAATLTAAETTALRTRVRTISPRARWATGDRFEVAVLEADVDGDRRPDRIAVGTIVDFSGDGERVVVAIAVGLAGKPFEIVDFNADRVAILGTIDLDGDGRHEVLIDRVVAGDASNYRYELMHVQPGKPLAMELDKPGGISAAWQAYDLLEERERDQG